MVTIRPAKETDLKTLCDLYFEFHEFHAHYFPSFLQSLGEPSAKELEELGRKVMEIIQGSGSTILVAEESGRVVGFAEIYLRQPDPDNLALTPTIHAHLQSLLVTSTFRRKGIGRRLLRAAEAWAIERGAVELRLDIWEFSTNPFGFYQKSGYHTYRRSLVKDLPSLQKHTESL